MTDRAAQPRSIDRVSSRDLPVGTVTFLFTDMEGSTRLWEDHPDVMHVVLARHDEILRAAIESHDGHVVKTTGDGFHAAFGTARDALEAAVAAQLVLAAQPAVDGVVVKVRMGVHTGEARARDGDYYGATLNRAARLMAVGHGGQVLLSDVTHGLAPGVTARDLGTHSVKDVGEVAIWQLTHPSLEHDFPPLRTLKAPNNLPAAVDSFVGRRAELADALDALRESRLVTLTGPGGSGKTRLALEAATAALPSFRNGVWFVSLAVAASGERVVPLVAAALGLVAPSDEPVADALEHWLRDRELVLVLDNCEPIVGEVSSFAERYLRTCAGVRILATSRELLGVRGERALLVPPLDVADDPAHPGESDAIELFMARASAAAPGFDANMADVAVVAQICRRLDGLPLAIELAAARLRALSVEQIATRLDDRFRLLQGGERTLEAVVAWSYDLLTDAEREVFIRLAVFPAGFNLEAAEMVVSDALVEEADILDLLTRLVEKSLVTTVITDGTYGYHLLETLRAYALARLAERGEVEKWTDRLLEWAMTRVDHVEASLRRPEQDAALQSVRTDAVTLRAAMDWASSRGDQLAALRIASAVPIALAGERRQIIAGLLAGVGDAADGRVAGVAYAALGELAYDQGDWLASSEALAFAREHFVAAGSDRDTGWIDLSGAYAAWGMGDFSEVDRLNAKAIAVFRGANDTLGLGYGLWVAALRTADLEEAQRLAAEADALLRATGSPMGIAHNVEGRGIIAYDRGELADAAGFVAEAVDLFARSGNPGCSAHALEAAATIVGRTGHAEVAIELLGAAEELRRTSGVSHKPWEIRARHGDIEDRIPALAPDARDAALGEGRQHTLESAARAALAALAMARD
jgi:predicted ATPase/class 3 adenylate cyclase